MSELRKIVIDGREIEVDPNLALIQACEIAGIEIPRFCYHERLSIAGNCRMCLVELVGAPKPAASCHMQVRDLRGGRNGEPPEVRTNSPSVKKAREGVMEFLLLNHPLDCPICDQGGECDLQDQAMAYGVDFSRSREHKRAMDEIYLGPLIKTEMTRCIQCTRCVRFVTEVAGVPEMGCTGRGEDAEIISYLNGALTSELQGNVIDLCPVGALTSKPYAFTARPWELTKTDSIDVQDGLGANIRIDARGAEVMRILPRENAELNEEWLDDKQRFLWDGLRRQRLDKPYVRDAAGKLKPASWDAAFEAIVLRLKGLPGEKIAALAGDLAPVEAMAALKQLMRALGSPHLDGRQDGALLPPAAPSAWSFNPGVAAIDAADAILLVGTNPRAECPLLNARLRRAWMNGVDVALIGEAADLTFEARHLGGSPRLIAEPPAEVLSWLEAAERPLILVGPGLAARPDGLAALDAAMALAERVGAIQTGEAEAEPWIGFGMIHTAAARVGAMEIGFLPHQTEDPAQMSETPTGKSTSEILAAAGAGDVEAVFLLGADEIDMSALGSAFVIYQGSHGDAGAMRADVILPGAAFTEEPGLFVNMEARPQLAARAGFPPGEAKENWAILRALSDRLGRKLPFDSLEALRAALFHERPRLAERIGRVPTASERPWTRFSPPAGATLSEAPLQTPIRDFFLTNPITRASETMADLSRRAAERRQAIAAE